ncbi:MAG: type II secretion system F family protein [Candidatus Riflebacteria bacterium]|nr:type II secretion system F family protein [Candidatus Riflebacteria bacterium]
MEKIVVRYADENGCTREETFETESREQLQSALKDRGFYILTEKALNDGVAAKIKEGLYYEKGVTVKELNEFTKMLRTLIKSGMPVNDAIAVLIDGAPETPLNTALKVVHADIKSGVSLSRALARHTNIFPNIYIKTIVAGERSGALEAILKRLVEYFNNSIAIRRKVTGALIYPAILFVVATLATSYMIVAVVPQFKDLFDGLGTPLPLPTKVLLSVSGFMADWFILLLCVFVLLLAGTIAYFRSTEGKEKLDKFKLNIPVLKKLERYFAYSQFSRTMATMLSGGIPLYDSLSVVLDSLENRVIASQLSVIPLELQRGKGFAKALKVIPDVPPLMIRIAIVGEESGNLDEMLDNLADHFDEEISELTDTITSLIEPVLFVGMAIVVGSVIISLLYPVLTAASQIN